MEFQNIMQDDELVQNFCAGFESLIKTNHAPHQFVGFESFCHYALKADDLDTHVGSEGFIKDVFVKFWNMIVRAYKAVKNFFFGDSEKKVKNAEDEIKKDPVIFNSGISATTDEVDSGLETPTQTGLAIIIKKELVSYNKLQETELVVPGSTELAEKSKELSIQNNRIYVEFDDINKLVEKLYGLVNKAKENLVKVMSSHNVTFKAGIPEFISADALKAIYNQLVTDRNEFSKTYEQFTTRWERMAKECEKDAATASSIKENSVASGTPEEQKMQDAKARFQNGQWVNQQDHNFKKYLQAMNQKIISFGGVNANAKKQLAA